MLIDQIHEYLDQASKLADEAATERNEQFSTEPYTFLAQLIDNALARAEQIKAKTPHKAV